MEGNAVCPACRAPLRADANYCVHCGLEFRHPCPACGGTLRLLATLDRGDAPWCSGCEALLDACERCGRWLLPGTGLCPDPQCAGRVLPPFPQYTGRRWDGAGTAVRFSLPPEWEHDHPDHQPPLPEWWISAAGMEAAFAAHGRLFLWEAGSLIVPSQSVSWPLREMAGEPGPVAWRSPLGPATAADASTRFEERVSVAGSRAVLATEAGYLQVDLRHPGGPALLAAGTPLAQAGCPGWWCGWIAGPDGPRLLAARSALAGVPLQAGVIPAPEEAVPATRARVVWSHGIACWPGRDTRVWAMDPEGATVRPISEAAPGLVDVWATQHGPRWVTEAQGQIAVTLTPARPGKAPVTVAAGTTPYRGVHSRGVWTVIVGERITTFHTHTGERLHEAVRPPGRWIDAVLVGGIDGEPRLLTLTRENGFANLTLVRLDTGVHDLLWREPGIEPRSLLPVEHRLYLAHTRGLLRFSASAPKLGQELPARG